MRPLLARFRVTAAIGLLAFLLVACMRPAAPVALESELCGACTPASTAEATGVVTSDRLRNRSDQPVRLVSVSLDSPVNLELVGASLEPTDGDFEAFNGPFAGHPRGVAASVVAPGELVWLTVSLRVTSATEAGTSRGLWVTLADAEGGTTRIHTCTSLVVRPADQTCDDDTSAEALIAELRQYC